MAIQTTLQSEVALYHGTVVRFASLDEGQQLITQRDAFIRNMSAFDRQSRLQQTSNVSEKAFLKHLRAQVLDWTESDKERWTKMITEEVAPLLAHHSLNLPKVIHIIKTSGLEEGGAAYTRGTSIFSVAGRMGQGTFMHELFHIISRHDARFRERMYQLIGFHPCLNEVTYPDSIAGKRITNPDAPFTDYYINITLGDKVHQAVPILFANRDYQDGPFFRYLDKALLVIEKQNGKHIPATRDGKPFLIDYKQVMEAFLDQVGRNTNYLIHPEEILADNFVLMLKGEKRATPSIQDQMKATLKSLASSE